MKSILCMFRVFIFAFVAFAPVPVLAYVGPGAGIGLIGSFIALVLAIVMALAAVLWWPVRHMMRRRKSKAAVHERDAVVEQSETPAPAKSKPTT